MSGLSKEVSGVSNGNAIYLSIIGGEMKQKVNEGREGAEKRTYKVKDRKTQEEVEGHKWEIQHQDIFGLINGVTFKTTDYGEQIVIELFNVEDQKSAIISTSSDGRYGTDFMKKLPNLDLTKEVCFNTYDFTPKPSEKYPDPKKKTGVSIEQDGTKIYSFYYDPKEKKGINGIPPVDEAMRTSMGKDYWKIFFMMEKTFLKGEAEKIDATIVKQTPNETAPEITSGDKAPDDLPF
jgi:hypothetical protein